MEYRYTNFHNNIIAEYRFTKEAKGFPLFWFGKFSAEQGGESTIKTSYGEGVQVSVRADDSFEEVKIKIDATSSTSEQRTKIQKALQEFLDGLVRDVVAED